MNPDIVNSDIGELLDAREPGPAQVLRPEGSSSIVLVCDHASNRIPLSLNHLGLGSEALLSHIAWDPGAAALARLLSERLDATLVLSNYSRLVIDCNRSPDHHQSIATTSAGIIVPDNQNLSPQQSLQRRHCLFDPYHRAIAEILDSRDPTQTRLLSIHSFTPHLNGEDRPWAIGVCYDREISWAREMRLCLQQKTSEPVGDNEPYYVTPEEDFTVPFHGDQRGISALMLELRQDRLTSDSALEQWSEHITDCCRH